MLTIRTVLLIAGRFCQKAQIVDRKKHLPVIQRTACRITTIGSVAATIHIYMEQHNLLTDKPGAGDLRLTHFNQEVNDTHFY